MSRAALIHEWNVGEKRYRLIAVGKWSRGYEDSYTVEELGQDGLGEPRWNQVAGWEPSKGAPGVADLLVGAVKSLLVDQRERVREARAPHAQGCLALALGEDRECNCGGRRA